MSSCVGGRTFTNVSRQDGFVDALLASPLGVSLLATLEAGPAAHGGWSGAAPVTSPDGVAAAVDAVGSISFGDLAAAAVSTGMSVSGPWIGDAPDDVASGYRHAGARAPIAQALNDRFGERLHAPLDLDAQEWWTDNSSWFESLVPLFRDFERVDGAGQFTWAGLWTVSEPPEVAHAEMLAAWEYEVGPVRRLSLPVLSEARVFEVQRPEDWARLVGEHPREGASHPEWELPGINQHTGLLSALLSVPGQRGARTTIGRHLVPDWRSVAERYDGIHLSWAGFITSEGCITDLGNGGSAGEVAMLRYWFSERTLWLADVFGAPRPAPDPLVEWPDRGNRERPRWTVAEPEQMLARLLGR